MGGGGGSKGSKRIGMQRGEGARCITWHMNLSSGKDHHSYIQYPWGGSGACDL